MTARAIIELCILCLLAGVAVGGWLLVWIGRWHDQRVMSTMATEKEHAWRCGYGRGYAAALGIRAEIDAPREKRIH